MPELMINILSTFKVLLEFEAVLPPPEREKWKRFQYVW